MAAAVSELRRHGVIVHEVPPFIQGEDELAGENAHIGSIQFFPRDPCLVVGNSLFELSLVNQYRRKEFGPLRRLLATRDGGADHEVLSMPGAILPGKYRARAFQHGKLRAFGCGNCIDFYHYLIDVAM